MIQYTPTPDYYNEYIQHGWLKDQAAKAHKYIERWRGKNGKWYYRYKSKIQNAFTKFNRNRLLKNWQSAYQDPGDRPRKRNADEITTNYGRKMLMRWDNGKPKSYWQKENSGNPIFNQKTLNAARKRAGVKVKKSKNLRAKGYSSSRTGGKGVSAFSKVQGYNNSNKYGISRLRKEEKDRERKNHKLYGLDIASANYFNNKAKKIMNDPKSTYSMHEKKKINKTRSAMKGDSRYSLKRKKKK